MEPTTRFTDGGISADAYFGTSVDSVWHGFFDFGVVGASWDARCQILARCTGLNFGTLAIVNPKHRDRDGLQDAHFDEILKWAKSHSLKQVVIDSDSCDLKMALAELRSNFWNTLKTRDESRPARVFIDVTTCTRFLTLAFFRESLFSGMVAEVTLGYSEGKYPDANPSYGNLEELAFNDGILQSIPVPGMYGEFEPSKEKFFLISVGFDGWKTLNLVVRKEPERVAILLCSPGVEPGYEERTMTANRALIDRYAVFGSKIVRARAGDAVAAWKELSMANIEDFTSENVFYMCAGSKPHSVALALRAMTQESAALIYNCPVEHTPVEVKICEKFWSYCVRLSDGAVWK